MTTDSELEGLQCAPFHAPPAVGRWDVRARNLCLQARLQQLTGVSWDVSCQYNDWTMSFLCMTPAVTLDTLDCTRFVKRSHGWPPEQWTRPEVEEAARLVAWSYKWDMARSEKERAEFHVPPSLAHLHPSHLKAMQEVWPAWFPSGEADPYYDEEVTPYTPKPPRIDDALMASLLYAKTSLPWQVQCSRDAHNMHFLCKELSTGVKLRTPTLEPELWELEALKRQADNIVWLYEREMAGRQGRGQ